MTEQGSDDGLRRLLADIGRGVLVTLKSDGRPQLSNVSHSYDPATKLIRVSVTADRAKTRNLVRDPRASYHVTSDDFWHWAVADGTAELTPVAADPHDATVEELDRGLPRDRRRALRLGRVPRRHGARPAASS